MNPQITRVIIRLTAGHLTLMFFLVFILLAQPVAAQQQVDTAAEAGSSLTGVWSGVRMQQDGQRVPSERVKTLRFVFSEEKLTMRVDDQVISDTKYKIDQAKEPPMIDLTYQGQPTLGIYRLDNDALTICLSGSADERPNRFISAANSPNRMLIHLKRGDLGPAGTPLFLINADGTGLRRMAGLPNDMATGSPDWSPDSKKIAFDAWRLAGNETSGDASVYVKDVGNPEIRRVAAGAMPSWSPDSQRITYCQYGLGRGVWVMDVDGSNPKQIDSDGWGSDWSPVGNEIAYTVSSGGGNIRIADPDSDKHRTILNTQQFQRIYWNFSWSPDGKDICFMGKRSDGTEEVAIVSTQGDAEGFNVLLTNNEGQYGAIREIVSWGRQGILVSMKGPGDENQQLYVVAADGDTPPKRLAGQDPQRTNNDMSWSPDGERIVFVAR